MHNVEFSAVSTVQKVGPFRTIWSGVDQDVFRYDMVFLGKEVQQFLHAFLSASGVV